MYRHSLWGVLVLIADIYAIVNILTDLVHGLLDPRLWEQL